METGTVQNVAIALSEKDSPSAALSGSVAISHVKSSHAADSDGRMLYRAGLAQKLHCPACSMLLGEES